jgi:hypothetical protein
MLLLQIQEKELILTLKMMGKVNTSSTQGGKSATPVFEVRGVSPFPQAMIEIATD